MKKVLSIVVLSFSVCLIVSCKKRLASGDTELVGNWSNNSTTNIQIKADGSGYSHYNDGSSYKNIDGKVIVEGEVITIKALGFREEYSIDQRPYTKNGKTLMDLDGDVYTKQ